MPTVTYEFIESADGRRAYLFDARNRARIEANLKSAREQIERYKAEGYDEAEVSAAAWELALRRELKTDDDLRFAWTNPATGPGIQTVVIRYNEPTADDADAVRDAEKPLREARKRLQPVVADTGDPVPLALLTTIEEECALACVPNLSEDKAVFTIFSPLPSKTAAASPRTT